MRKNIIKYAIYIAIAFIFASCKQGAKDEVRNTQNVDPPKSEEKENEKPSIDESLPNIIFKIASEAEMKKDEVELRLQIGGEKKGATIQIDWGDGSKKDYTFPTEDVAPISVTLDADSEVKIYGKLKSFDASLQKWIKFISFYNCASLEVLRISQNKIENIDLSPLSSLKELQITANKISKIDVSSLSNLQELYCAWNDIEVLDTSKNEKLTVLTCYNTKMQKLDVSSNKLLEVLKAGDNKYIEQPVLDANVNLKSIDFENCNFSSFNLEPFINIKNIWLSGNKMSSINLKNNTALIYVDISKNMLESIDLSTCEQIEELRLDKNKLKALDLSKNRRLNVIKLQNNDMSACELNKLFMNMAAPLNDKNGFGIKENPGSLTCKTDIVKNKGWRLDVEGDGSAPCPTP